MAEYGRVDGWTGRRAVTSLVAVLGLLGAPSLRAQDSAMTAAFAANRYALDFTGGTLSGPGGELLRREARRAMFTLIGEEHGVAEIPVLVRALLDDPASRYAAFAIEVSPLSARWLDELRRAAPDPARGLDSAFAIAGSLHWIPFYTMPAEQELLAWALGRELAIWGLDYEVWADRYWLGRLEAVVAPAARPAVQAARALADSGFARATRGDPSGIFSFTAPESVFTGLRSAARPAPGSETDRIIEVLETTVAINRPFLAGRNYESNLGRVTNLKRNFLRYLDSAAAGPPPRTLLKFGAYHMWRGLNPLRQYDVGNLAAQVAERHGAASLHVLAIGAPGTTHLQFDVSSLQYRPVPVEWAAEQWMAAAMAALPPDGAVVFDLRPLRPLIQNRQLRGVPPELEQVIYGFDLVVVVGQ